MSLLERRQILDKYREAIGEIMSEIADRAKSNNKRKAGARIVRTFSDVTIHRSRNVSVSSWVKRDGFALNLFNYNIVEGTLQFAAILVCTFGIMFDSSGGLSDTQENAVMICTIFTIFFATGYFLLVAWCEVIGGIFPKLRCEFLSGQVNEDEGDDDDVDEDEGDFDMFTNKARAARAPLSQAESTRRDPSERRLPRARRARRRCTREQRSTTR